MNKLRIGISPCPNDTYIFDAIYSKKINCKALDFEFIFEDVQTLNEMAIANELDVVKISYANYFNVISNYILLRSGGALGEGVGPLLISKQAFELSELALKNIAIPGIHTTAHFLLQFAFPVSLQKTVYPFSDIEGTVLNNEVDAGVIIHENRFTYQQKGLIKLMDLGEFWEQETQLPIPLGGIAISRTLPLAVQQQVNQLIVDSLSFSNNRYPTLSEFITCHAQEMSEDVMRQHIQLYVNNYSLDIGSKGLQAVEKMKSILLSETISLPLFIELS